MKCGYLIVELRGGLSTHCAPWRYLLVVSGIGGRTPVTNARPSHFCWGVVCVEPMVHESLLYAYADEGGEV